MKNENTNIKVFGYSTQGGLIDTDLMGDVWPSAEPGLTSADYGSAKITPNQPVEIRSFQTFELTFTAGIFGLDDTGGLKIVQRFTNDGGRWQTTDPKAMNYVTAHSSNGTKLLLEVEKFGHQRPWDRSLRVVVDKGSLFPGDTITVVFGDTSGGSPGLRMQTFCESAHEYKVLVDACATGHFVPLKDRPSISVVASLPAKWQAVIPTLRSSTDSFFLGLRADDHWGNPSHQVSKVLYLKCDSGLKGLPESVSFAEGVRSIKVTGLSGEVGDHQIEVYDQQGQLLTTSNIVRIEAGNTRAYWGDLHGQSGETVGINPIKEYFDFGRDLAFLDVMSHQANDFQIKNAFWEEINTVTTQYDSCGEFVAFAGYEWSGNTPTGGDHNVFYRNDEGPLIRSSHSLLADRSDLHQDANTTEELFEALDKEDCILYAHIGGRPANIAQADGKALRTSLEMHSDWGTFEWVMSDNFDLGYRHGVVCNSDGHKGRPGASHPGASQFGAFGGLTCFYTDELSRNGIFNAWKKRHHYGTTGSRIHLQVTAKFESPGQIYHSDPRLGDADWHQATEAVMGDIVAIQHNQVELEVDVQSASPVLTVDIMNAMDVVSTEYGFSEIELSDRYRVMFHGAEYRGRGRQTSWKGSLSFDSANIQCFNTVNAWNHERKLQQVNESTVDIDILTTGNFQGFDVECENASKLMINTNQYSGEVCLDSLGLASHVISLGGLERAIKLQRLPLSCSQTSLKFKNLVKMNPQGDTPVWVKVTTEDGHVAWSSPIYLFNK